MRLLSGSRRTTASQTPIEATPIEATPLPGRVSAATHVEVHEGSAVAREPDDLGARIARLPARAGSLTDGLEQLRNPLRSDELDAIAFVRALSTQVAAERAELEAAAALPQLTEARPALEPPRTKELLKAIGTGALSTREIAEAVGITAASALHALRALEEQGGVASSAGPGRARQWVVTKQKKKKKQKK